MAEQMRKQSEHTPGPWRKCGGGTPHYCAIDSAAGYIVFGFADYQVTREHGELVRCPGYDEQMANARLISAAPDLLAAVEGALRIKDLWAPNDNWPVEFEHEAVALQLMLEGFGNAVAKARSLPPLHGEGEA